MPTKKIVKKLYGGKVAIEFTPTGHTYNVNGKRAISVTSVTGILEKNLKWWAVGLFKNFLVDILATGRAVTRADVDEGARLHDKRKKEAGDIGTAVHDWAEAYIKGMNPQVPKEGDPIHHGVVAFLSWVDEFGIKFIESERVVYSLLQDYVGIMDCAFTMACENHEIVHVGDFKTGNYKVIKDKNYQPVGEAPYFEHRLQVAGYAGAYFEETGTTLGDNFIIYFGKETGDFKVFEVGNFNNDYNAFLGCLVVKRRQKSVEEAENKL
jgi:hypothetical protein